MRNAIEKLSDRILAMVVPQHSAAAVDCYYIYKCIAGTKLRAHCCDGSCGKYVIVCNTCC
ncbi:hypothetical protein GCM10020216_037070 [Nonomuraea helvata]